MSIAVATNAAGGGVSDDAVDSHTQLYCVTRLIT